MTKFEQIGVNYQHDAETPKQAMNAFKYSCNCCCSKGMRIDCDKCAIAATHNLVMACFNKKGGAAHENH